MTVINAVIIDDVNDNIEIIRSIIERHCSEKIKIVGVASNLDEGIFIVNKLKPELIFLDIVLGEDSGFTLLDVIDNYYYKLVFVTSFNNYAIKAIKYSALDYLLKPISTHDLLQTVNKVYKSISDNIFTNKTEVKSFVAEYFSDQAVRTNFLAIASDKSTNIIKKEDIIFCKSYGAYTKFFLVDETEVLSSINLGEYEKMLGKSFYRSHRKYILNLTYVERIYNNFGVYCEMINGMSIPVSIRKKKTIFQIFGLRNNKI